MRRFFAAVLLFIAASLTALPASAQTAACDCWCGTQAGAIKIGQFAADACSDACQAQHNGAPMVACARTLEEHPDTYAYCFTREQCTGFTSADGSTTGRFESPVDHCTPDRGYCYPQNNRPIDLAFAIGGATSVNDLGDYINTLYSFVLGAAVTVAIVLIMIGGVQYVISAQSGDLKQAKDRIKNAVIGFILLMGAYVILFTVNPQLVRLQSPQLPLPRPVGILDGFSCEDFIGQQYGLTDDRGNAKTSGTCGEKALVATDPSGVAAANGTFCQFTGCSDGKQCIISGNEGQCVSCAQVTPDNNFNLEPSSSLCSTLEAADKVGNAREGDRKTRFLEFNECFYAVDADVNTIGSTNAFDVSAGTCAELKIDCRTQVRSCADYDELTVQGADDAPLEDIGAEATLGGQTDDIDIETICAQDPCWWARANDPPGSRCTYTDSGLPDAVEDNCTVAP